MQYHSQDIVSIRAKVKYTTLIELPTSEKIMEAATGDKEFWIVDVVGNFCFVHPAKQGISSNLNLITDKGNIYSFTLQDISATSTTPDLKVIVEPADRSAIVAASGPPQFVPAAQLEQSRQQLAALQSHVEQAVDEYKSAYGYRYGKTTGVERLHHVVGEERNVSIPIYVHNEIRRHHHSETDAEVIVFHNHPRIGNEGDGLYFIKTILDDLQFHLPKMRSLSAAVWFQPCRLGTSTLESRPSAVLPRRKQIRKTIQSSTTASIP